MPVPIDFIIKSLNASITLKSRSNPKFPCGICSQNVNYNNPSKQCSLCHYWIHVKCTDISVEEHSNPIQSNQNQPDVTENKQWIRPKCTITKNTEMFPFGLQSGDNIKNMNSSNSMHKLDIIPEFEITSTITKIDDICFNAIDNSITNNVNCKYYINEEFSNLPKTKNSFNIPHANVNDIENHIEDLLTVLVDPNLHFNAICISGTSQKENTMLCKHVDLKNYHTPISTGTKTVKGGTAIYVLKNPRFNWKIWPKNQ